MLHMTVFKYIIFPYFILSVIRIAIPFLGQLAWDILWSQHLILYK